MYATRTDNGVDKVETITNYDELLFSFVVFFFEVIERIINACVGWGIFFAVFFVIGKYLLFRKDPEGWDELAAYTRSGVKDAFSAFAAAMPAVKESAKHWAAQKINKLRG